MKELDDYKFALDQIAIVAVTDANGIILYANENFCKISQYSKEELLGKDHCLINSGLHPEGHFEELWATIRAGKVWKGQLPNVAKDGSEYWVEMTIVPFLDPNGNPYQYLAIRTDLSQVKETEQELIQGLKELSDYKYALDASSIVAITDANGIIKYVNDNFCKISKYDQSELLGNTHSMVNSGHHPKDFIKNLWQTISKGIIWRGEIKNRAKDGTLYWVDTTIVPFLDKSGKPEQYLAIRYDITSRKIAEEKLLATARSLEYKNTQLVDFCNIVSHNLRAPLINIAMLADFIEESQDPDEQKELLSKIKPVTKHVMDIFNELVESLQVQQDTALPLDEIVLDTTLTKVLSGFEAQIKESNAEILLNFEEAPVLYCPNKYIESICGNLISNALKYRSVDRTPCIVVKTHKRNGATLLSVKDNGLGIDLDLHKDKLFKIRKTFHKHPDAKGFGLFITKTQVEAIQGRIWVESVPEKGSTFFVEFKNPWTWR